MPDAPHGRRKTRRKTGNERTMVPDARGFLARTRPRPGLPARSRPPGCSAQDFSEPLRSSQTQVTFPKGKNEHLAPRRLTLRLPLCPA